MKNIYSIDQLEKHPSKILYIYAPDMNYHEKFYKMLEVIEKESDVKCFTLNVSSDLSLTKRFDFRSVPCLLLFKENRLNKKHEGMISKKDLKKIFRL